MKFKDPANEEVYEAFRMEIGAEQRFNSWPNWLQEARHLGHSGLGLVPGALIRAIITAEETPYTLCTTQKPTTVDWGDWIIKVGDALYVMSDAVIQEDYEVSEDGTRVTLLDSQTVGNV